MYLDPEGWAAEVVIAQQAMIASTVTAVLRFGSTDCERFHVGSVAQPVNAWSSLVFLAAGLFILYGASRQPEARKELVAFGVLVAANAVGSFVYHGLAFAWGHWAHDVPAVGIPLFIAVHDLGLVRGWPVSRRLFVFGALLSLAGVVLLFLRRRCSRRRRARWHRRGLGRSKERRGHSSD